ncbi:MAG: hypothetical protein P9E67_16730, partial [Candidatus Competibacter sp.]|nr:hypothetical protein [Candidatus Competibacter sp.]
RLAWRPSAQGFAIDRIDSATNCSYSISPTNNTAAARGGSYSVEVATQNGCFWTAQSKVDWITIATGTNGTGPGTVTYSVAINSSGSARLGALTIANQTLTVAQTAGDGGGH